MSLYGFVAFCAVYLLAVATPGPGVAAVLARSLTYGLRGAPSFIGGFVIGDLMWFAAAAVGLAALAQSAQTVFLLLPTIIHMRALRIGDYLLIGLAIAFILPLVLGAYALAASRARLFFRKASSIHLLNRGGVFFCIWGCGC